MQKDAPPALLAAEVLYLLTLSRTQCKLLVDSKPQLKIGPGQAMDESCAKILSGLQISSARLNVMCCYARLLEVQLEDTDAAGGLTADKAWLDCRQAAVLLPDTMLDCISQAVLEVTVRYHSIMACFDACSIQARHQTCMQRPLNPKYNP